MNTDPKTIASLVEIITREVLTSILQRQTPAEQPDNGCKFSCAEGICVQTCFDKVGQVIHAGAERVSNGLGGVPQDLKIASMIDHTLLKPDATQEQIAQLCFEAKRYGFASVCVNPTWIELCAKLLQGSAVKVCTVIGFPLGANTPEVKAFETAQAIQLGAQEVDMVINIGALKSRDLQLVARDIRGVVKTAHEKGVLVKVIIETGLLTDEEKVIACLISKEVGADFVKTSTGFSGGGATVNDVALMRRVVGPQVGVKASGGVRTFEDAEQMIKAGANRIGASASVKIVSGAQPAESPAKSPEPVLQKSY
ncbi:MAG TPA: deoxyribose-phosphate aldolase [Anaerolineaceae bacterium]|nr:deoxyribose-phosphate aldolase [Anaerolineaceae bacterium]